MCTDSGPDHRLTDVSVQISLISIFLSLNLDFLCAVRTPPYHSWKNPAERMMSILNIGLQYVGVMRQETKSYEDSLRSCNNLAAIQRLAESHPDLEEEILDAVAPMKALLQHLFTRLQLKGVQFQTFEAAAKSEMNDLWKNVQTIDETLRPENTTKPEIQTKEKYERFVQQHCKVRHYNMFSVKKCRDPLCVCKPLRLPDDVFDSLCHLPDPCPDDDHYKDYKA